MIAKKNAALWLNSTTGGQNIIYGNSVTNLVTLSKIILSDQFPSIQSGTFQKTFDQAVTLRYSNKYAPYVYQAQANKQLDTVPYADYENLFTKDIKNNINIMFFDSTNPASFEQVYVDKQQMLAGARSTYSSPGTIAENMSNCNWMQPASYNAPVVLGGINKNYLVLVPRLIVRDLAGNTQSYEWGNYSGQAQIDYPYIVQITTASIRYVYNGSVFAKTLFPCFILNNFSRPLHPLAGYPTGDLFTGYSMQAVHQYIYLAPQFLYYSGNTVYFRYMTNSTHGKDISQYTFDNNGRPFGYIDLLTARKIINSLGLWWGDTTAHVTAANVKGTATTSSNIHCPFVQETGDTTTSDISGQAIYEYFINHQDVSDDPMCYNPEGFKLNGSQIETNPAMNPESTQDFLGASGYDPLTPIPPDPDEYNQDEIDPLDPENPSEELELNDTSLNPLGAFVKYYIVSYDLLKNINNTIFSDNDIISRLGNALAMFGSNLMESFVSLTMYPFDVTALARTLQYEEVRIGGFMSGFQAAVCRSDTKMILDLGTGYVPGKYHNFLDTSPYTALTLYIPYVGTVTLDINEFLYKKLGVKLIIDITTGMGKAVIYADNALVTYKESRIGISMPFTSTDNQQFLGACIQAAASAASLGYNIASAVSDISAAKLASVQLSAAANEGGSVYSSDPAVARRAQKAESAAIKANDNYNKTVENSVGKIVGQGAEIPKEIYSALSAGNGVNMVGTSSPASNLNMPQSVFFIISRPTPQIPSNYGHTYGYVCHENNPLSFYSGFTVCQNPDLSNIPSALEEEKSEIYELLTKGVYL